MIGYFLFDEPIDWTRMTGFAVVWLGVTLFLFYLPKSIPRTGRPHPRLRSKATIPDKLSHGTHCSYTCSISMPLRLETVMNRFAILIAWILSLVAMNSFVAAQDLLTYDGKEGIGKGKHIVFIANDHEYRSEQTCPLIARMLAKEHGFKCTVLFGVDENGYIKAGAKSVPGMKKLAEADLCFFFTRFMSLSDEEVQPLVDYLERGGPMVGIRTSTHAFNGQQGKWSKLNFNYEGEDYLGGMGEQVFGNTWHKTRGPTALWHQPQNGLHGYS